MSDIEMYHDGSRQLQERFETRRLADRLVEVIAHTTFTDADRAFIEGRPMFFLATADNEGRPDCSYKGGRPGFIRVVEPGTLAFPSYDGNGMFKSLGNILVNPYVGMLFIDFESPKRLRVNGRASVREDDPRRFLDLSKDPIELLLGPHQRIDMLHRQHLGQLRSCRARHRGKRLAGGIRHEVQMQVASGPLRHD